MTTWRWFQWHVKISWPDCMQSYCKYHVSFQIPPFPYCFYLNLWSIHFQLPSKSPKVIKTVASMALKTSHWVWIITWSARSIDNVYNCKNEIVVDFVPAIVLYQSCIPGYYQCLCSRVTWISPIEMYKPISGRQLRKSLNLACSYHRCIGNILSCSLYNI